MANNRARDANDERKRRHKKDVSDENSIKRNFPFLETTTTTHALLLAATAVVLILAD